MDQGNTNDDDKPLIKFKSDPSTKLNLIAQIEANIDPDLLNTSDKWALMDEVISHYKTVNLEHLEV